MLTSKETKETEYIILIDDKFYSIRGILKNRFQKFLE